MYKRQEYSAYIDSLLERAMVRKLSEEPEIDLESLSEMESAALELETVDMP